MILSAQSLAARGIVSPFSERGVINGMSFGVSSAGYDVRVRQEVRQSKDEWGRVILASTVEHFAMPDDVLGHVCDKSTWARRGVFVQNTIIEPGWRGWLTLEITTARRDEDLLIEAGSPIAQIVFHLLNLPTDKPYNGKYQDQKRDPQEAIFDKT